METLRQKARVLSLAWLHQVADAAIDTHSIPVVQQHIRDLEQAMSDLREAQAQNAGVIAGLNRQISQLHQQEAVLNTQADALLQLNPPREDLAATVEQRLEEVENNLTPLNNQLEKSQAIQAQYEQAMSALEAKHTTMMRQLRTLQSLDTSASAEDRAAHALHAEQRTWWNGIYRRHFGPYPEPFGCSPCSFTAGNGRIYAAARSRC